MNVDNDLKTIGYKKLDENVGGASYILYENWIRPSNHEIAKVETKRVDLEVVDWKRSRIYAYKPDTSCPYGGRKCAMPLYSGELALFVRKSRRLRWAWFINKLKTGVAKRLRKVFK